MNFGNSGMMDAGTAMKAQIFSASATGFVRALE